MCNYDTRPQPDFVAKFIQRFMQQFSNIMMVSYVGYLCTYLLWMIDFSPFSVNWTPNGPGFTSENSSDQTSRTGVMSPVAFHTKVLIYEKMLRRVCRIRD